MGWGCRPLELYKLEAENPASLILPKFLLMNRFSTARREIYRFIGNVLFYRTISQEGKQPDSSNREKGETGIYHHITVEMAPRLGRAANVITLRYELACKLLNL